MSMQPYFCGCVANTVRIDRSSVFSAEAKMQTNSEPNNLPKAYDRGSEQSIDQCRLEKLLMTLKARRYN